MPYKTFTASVLSSADMNTYLMKQAVITCTSGTRPASPVQGMTIYETDTNLYATYDGTAWGYALGGYQNYTPTITGITALGNGAISGRWARVGDNVKGWVRFAAGTTTVYSGTTIAFGLPTVTGSVYGAGDILGHGQVDNNSTATRTNVEATAAGASVSAFGMVYDGGVVTNTAPFTFGANSRAFIQFDYEMA